MRTPTPALPPVPPPIPPPQHTDRARGPREAAR